MKLFLYFMPFLIVFLTSMLTYNKEQLIHVIPEASASISEQEQEQITYLPFGDELPKTLSINTDPDINRLAHGIVAWKTKHRHGIWFECGRKYKPTQFQEKALEHAHHIVRVARKYKLNYWAIAATVAKESQFDRCAIGKYTREWARSNKLLKPRYAGHFKRTLSHPKKDVISVLHSSQWKNRWRNADIGVMQVLWPVYYRGKPGDMLTLEPGLDIQAKKMRDWADFYKTDVPWAYWTGRKSSKRHNTILYIAHRLGAQKDEI